MLSARKIKVWYAVHKWTSLVCTIFLLMLCLTGLPLIFHHEIEELTGDHVAAAPMPEGTPNLSLDRVLEAGQKAYPGMAVQFVSWDEEEHPGQVFLSMAESRRAPSDNNKAVVVDARTGEVLATPNFAEGFMYVMYKLHVDMFAGLPGMLFLGFMGLLFVASIVSGTVIYGPFMRKLDFGTVRYERSTRVKWLDLHNLLGVVTLLWALVVGMTGVINTWADLVFQYWRYDQMAEMVAPYAGQPPLVELGSLEAAMQTARQATPDMTPSFVAFPGTAFSSEHHYMVAMKGETPLTSRLLRPVMVDATTAALTDTRELPWYLTTLLISQPLHFGDYGGMPLKILWAVLDIVSIVVLGSGLYLWIARRKAPIEARIAELERREAEGMVLARGRAS
ncbi:PepSY-associated TM helix domain-containing protein [Oceanibaculum pacificum]|uniref:Peptidase n=1 Tax=Oceanibaculum pacificum TaxID=580166 RepID=A0A154W3L1_9PROT|nr:PepSY domain-containing protein [Oceanibaculum pacificum]KZD08172.1 peptidase [Oceanibaculum pacificum]